MFNLFARNYCGSCRIGLIILVILMFPYCGKKASEEQETPLVLNSQEAFFDSLSQSLEKVVIWRGTYPPESMPKSLWQKNDDAGKIDKIYINEGKNKTFKSFIGYNEKGDPIGAYFTKTNGLGFLSGQISFTFKDREEARISLLFKDYQLSSSIIYVPDSSYNVKLIITDTSPATAFGPDKNYNVKIFLAADTLQGDITPGMKSPSILVSLGESLKKISGTGKVAAFDPTFLATIAQGLPSQVPRMIETKSWQEGACIVGTALSDFFTVFVTAGYGLVNYLLVEDEKQPAEQQSEAEQSK